MPVGLPPKVSTANPALVVVPVGLPPKVPTVNPALVVVPVGLPHEVPTANPALVVVPVGLPFDTANPAVAVVPVGLPFNTAKPVLAVVPVCLPRRCCKTNPQCLHFFCLTCTCSVQLGQALKKEDIPCVVLASQVCAQRTVDRMTYSIDEGLNFQALCLPSSLGSNMSDTETSKSIYNTIYKHPSIYMKHLYTHTNGIM